MKKCLIILVVLFGIILGGAGCWGPSNHDPLAGTAWTSLDDHSYWAFDMDQGFHWYNDQTVTDDNYFAGTYEFHMGQDALDYLTHDLARYEVTEEEMMGVINRSKLYTLETFICFSTTNQSFLLDGVEQLKNGEEAVTSYFGFLLEDGTYLDIANMDTGTYYRFTKDA